MVIWLYLLYCQYKFIKKSLLWKKESVLVLDWARI